MERYKFLDKFGPNKAIAKTYKGTNSCLEDLTLELQILKGTGMYSSKIHSSRETGEIDKQASKIFFDKLGENPELQRIEGKDRRLNKIHPSKGTQLADK